MSEKEHIHIYNEVGWLCPIHPIKLKVIVQAMLSHAGLKLGHVAIYLVRDGDIMPINIEHLSCSGPTNVLSFPADKKVSTEDNPHTIIISVDTLKRECILYHQDIIIHFLHLLAHGLGHIMGYEHGEAMFSLCDKMEAQAKELLEASV